MGRKWFVWISGGLLWATALLILLGVQSASGVAASPNAPPTILEVSPPTGANDLNTSIVVTGTGFTAVPTVSLGSTLLQAVTWLSDTRLAAVVPWGLLTGTYPLTVTNPGGESASLADAFTVTQGFGVWTTNGPYGGSILDVVIHPVTSTTLYAVAPSVGVLASYNSAETWELILFEEGREDLTFDAHNPQVMYSGGGGPPRRTMDGGSTWEQLPSPHYSLDGCSISHPAPHPTLGNRVYVASSACPGFPLRPDEGGVFSSDDCGGHWFSRTLGLTDTHVTDIAFHPDDPDKMLVGTLSGNLFLSTDGGQSWNWIARLGSHVERVYFNPFGAHEAWATNAGRFGIVVSPPYLYKSTDPDLAAWTPITVTDSAGWSYPVNSLTFASDTLWAAAGYGFASTDGGANWSPLGWAGQPDDEVRAFALDPNDPDVVYAGRGTGGVFKSSDRGLTWSEANEGLAAVIPQALAVPRTDLDTVYAYTYERGLLKSNNGGRSWIWSYGQAGGTPSPWMLAIDPFSPTRLYLGHRRWYYLCLNISEDAGATWREVTATVPISWSGTDVDMDIVAPHPLMSGTILAGMNFYPPGVASSPPGGIFASDDHGESWRYRWPPPAQPISSVVGLAYDAVDPNLIYVGTGGTGLWKSTDRGWTWQPVPIPGVLPPIGIESVATHPDISHTVYVRLYSTAATPNPEAELYVSEDAGATWAQLGDVEQSGGLWFAPSQPGQPRLDFIEAQRIARCFVQLAD